MRLSGRIAVGCFLLLPAPALAAAENVKLNGALAVNHAVASSHPGSPLSPRSDLVVYGANQVEGGPGLYVVPIAGGTPLQLAPFLGPGSISPDGEWLVFHDSTPPSTRLYSVPVEGGAVTPLNPPVVPGGEVFFHQIHPDSSRVLYVAEQEAIDAHELFSVPIGGGATTKLNLPFEDGDGGVISLGITPNGEWAFFAAGERFVEFEEDGLVIRRLVDVELFRVPLSGGGSAESAEDVQPLAPPQVPPTFSPDSSRFLFQAREGLSDPMDLYSAPLLGGEATRLNPPITAFGGALGVVDISPDSSRVVFDGIVETSQVSELFSVPLGGGAATRLSEPRSVPGGVLPGHPISPDSSLVVFRVFETMTDIRLASVPLAGGPVLRLDAGSGPVYGFAISPDGSRVVYETYAGGEFRLFSVPIAGGAVAPLGPGASPVVFTPDSSRVVFVSSFETDANLYSIGAGGGRRSRLNGPLVSGGDVRSFWITPDGERVIYQADQDTDERIELYSSRIPAPGPPLSIEIEPKKTPNKVKPSKKGRITVALLGSAEVDVGTVAADTLAFGGSYAAPDGRAKRSDVNRDGFEDLVTRYKVSETGIQMGDTSACLTGEIAGDPFVVCDAITTLR